MVAMVAMVAMEGGRRLSASRSRAFVEVGRGGGREEGRMGKRAVSYTHLTLPTIYSV